MLPRLVPEISPLYAFCDIVVVGVGVVVVGIGDSRTCMVIARVIVLASAMVLASVMVLAPSFGVSPCATGWPKAFSMHIILYECKLQQYTF